MSTSSLIDVNDSILIVIDIQPHFVKKESKMDPNPLLQRMCWVIKVANWLDVPLIVTAEDMPRTGSVAEEVAEILLPDTKIYNKMTFGLAAQPDIFEAVHQTQRKTAVLIGYETDVYSSFSLGSHRFGLQGCCRWRRDRITGRSTPNWTGTNSSRGWDYCQCEESVL